MQGISLKGTRFGHLAVIVAMAAIVVACGGAGTNELPELDSAEEYFELGKEFDKEQDYYDCLLYTSPSPRDGLLSRMPSSA